MAGQEDFQNFTSAGLKSFSCMKIMGRSQPRVFYKKAEVAERFKNSFCS
jgi:hypothetical protein